MLVAFAVKLWPPKRPFSIGERRVCDAIVLRRDQPTVPTQNRLGRRERRQLGQHGPAEPLSLLGHEPALASVNRRRLVPRRSRSTRFSACRYAMASCCRRWIQPAIRRTRNWNGVAGFGGLTAGARQSPVAPAPEGAAIAKALRFTPGPVSGQDAVSLMGAATCPTEASW